jgi:hypothetical protein
MSIAPEGSSAVRPVAPSQERLGASATVGTPYSVVFGAEVSPVAVSSAGIVRITSP